MPSNTAKGVAAAYSAEEVQKKASQSRTLIQKATKALVVIIAGFSLIFLLRLFKLLKRKKKGEEVDPEISSLKSEWRSRMVSALRDGYLKGAKIGVQAASIQGVKSSGTTQISEDIIDQLLSDVDNIIADAESLLQSSLENESSVPDKVRKSIILRLQMSGEAALKHGVADTMESVLASTTTQKMWVATSKEPCSHCRRLNGMRRDWGEEFPHSFTGIYKLKVYGGVLLGPLRHPNCLCILVRVPKEK